MHFPLEDRLADQCEDGYQGEHAGCGEGAWVVISLKIVFNLTAYVFGNSFRPIGS